MRSSVAAHTGYFAGLVDSGWRNRSAEMMAKPDESGKLEADMRHQQRADIKDGK